MSGRKCKSISFDLTETHERELLAHAQSQGKFSRYVKRLIAADRAKVVNTSSMPFEHLFEQRKDEPSS